MTTRTGKQMIEEFGLSNCLRLAETALAMAAEPTRRAEWRYFSYMAEELVSSAWEYVRIDDADPG